MTWMRPNVYVYVFFLLFLSIFCHIVGAAKVWFKKPEQVARKR